MKSPRNKKSRSGTADREAQEVPEEKRHPSMGVVSPGVVTTPVGIANVLQNVGNYMYLSVGLNREREVMGETAQFLEQVDQLVQHGREVVSVFFEKDSPALSDVVRAKVLLDEMQAWTFKSRVLLSGKSAEEPLLVSASAWRVAEELVAVGRTLARYWAELNPGREDEPFGLDPELDQTSLDCLQAMVELDAISEDQRRTADQIGERAIGADGNKVKKILAALAKNRIVAAKEGRGGGTWITEYGRGVLQRKMDAS